MLRQRAFARFRRHHVMRLGIDGQAQIGLADLAEHGVDLAEAIHFVAQQFDAVGVIVISGEDLDNVAPHAKRSAREAVIVALVEDFDQAREDLLARDLLALFEHQQHAVIGFGRAEAVDATHARDNDAVPAFEKRTGSGEAELVQLVVDGGFFFDVDIAGGHVGFRLIIVVITDEILDGIAREERLELVIKLRRQGLVVGQDERRTAGLFDQLGHGVGFAGAGDAEQQSDVFRRPAGRGRVDRWRRPDRPAGGNRRPDERP